MQRGANRKSAELSGINTDKIRWLVFIMTGLLCGIAAVVIGGCAFSGGRGDVFGSAIGAVFMAVLQNGILKYNLPTAAQLVVKGVVIVIMIIFDAVYNDYMQKRIQKKAKEATEMAGGEA